MADLNRNRELGEGCESGVAGGELRGENLELRVTLSLGGEFVNHGKIRMVEF